MIEIRVSEVFASLNAGIDPIAGKALRLPANAHPERRIGVDAREFFARSGGSRCTTQQPSAI